MPLLTITRLFSPSGELKISKFLRSLLLLGKSPKNYITMKNSTQNSCQISLPFFWKMVPNLGSSSSTFLLLLSSFSEKMRKRKKACVSLECTSSLWVQCRGGKASFPELSHYSSSELGIYKCKLVFSDYPWARKELNQPLPLFYTLDVPTFFPRQNHKKTGTKNFIW